MSDEVYKWLAYKPDDIPDEDADEEEASSGGPVLIPIDY